jgi:hypothetical protein
LPVGASLLLIGAKPFYAWMTGFWSLGMAKLSLNIITGLAATAILIVLVKKPTLLIIPRNRSQNIQNLSRANIIAIAF